MNYKHQTISLIRGITQLEKKVISTQYFLSKDRQKCQYNAIQLLQIARNLLTIATTKQELLTLDLQQALCQTLNNIYIHENNVNVHISLFVNGCSRLSLSRLTFVGTLT